MGTSTVNISAAQVRELRDKTGAPMMDCKQALAASAGDVEKAIDWLRKKGISTAAKKATRVTSEGSVASYIHAGGKIGVLVEVNCESDFVARTDDFKDLVRDIAMHIAASDPKFIRKEDVTPEAYDREKEIYRAQAASTGKPAQAHHCRIVGAVFGHARTPVRRLSNCQPPGGQSPGQQLRDRCRRQPQGGRRGTVGRLGELS